MNLLPDDMIHLIFNNIKIIKDKKNFLRTCKKYYDMFRIFRNNIKYAIFVIGSRDYNEIIFELKGIFDNLDTCRKCIKAYLLPFHEFCPPSKNDYTIMATTNDVKFKYVKIEENEMFVIEEREMNKFDYLL